MPIQRPHFQLDEEYAQLALGLELPEVELEGVTPEEARLRSEAGRSALTALKGAPAQPAWFERFERLINSGWPWRQATYIAWASMPKEGRTPDTQEKLAREFLNLTSDRAINTWRKKNPAIDSMIAIMQSAELWEHRADGFKNLLEGMKRSGADYKFFHYLKLYEEMTGDYVPLTQLAAVLRKKADGEVSDLDESMINELADAADELNRGAKAPPLNLTPSPSPKGKGSKTEGE